MSSKKKKDDNIIVSFLGGNSSDVTGSATLISYLCEEKRRTILIELGMIQGNKTVLEEYRENKKMIDNIPLKDVSEVFVLHPHCDHIGLLPTISSNNPDCRVITTKACAKISEKLLLDASHIHKENMIYLKEKGNKVNPLYMEKDTYDIISRFETYEIGKVYELDKMVSFRFLNNSHVVGATQLELWIKKKSGQTKKLLFTSDLGSKTNKSFQYFTKDTEIVPKANLMVIESTYGGKPTFTKQECIEERKKFKELVNEYVLQNKRRAFTPVFSFCRLQNMMCLTYELFKDTWDYNIPIIVDTRLGNQINDVYENVLEGEDLEYWKKVKSWKAFTYIKEYPSTIAFLSKKNQPALIFSSAGMITAGHSTLYAQQVLQSSKDIMVFCGYCSPNSIGGRILNEEQKTVMINKQVIQKRCRIERLSTFSSHAQENDLVDYIKNINCDKIILQHGSKESKLALKNRAIEELRKINKTTPIVVCEKGMQIKL